MGHHPPRTPHLMEQGTPHGTAESPRVDFDAVCRQVQSAFGAARAHTVSLHDAQGEVLWLSENSLGPDEHEAVRLALERFAAPQLPGLLIHDLGDARSAVLLRVVGADRRMIGIVMVVVDARVTQAVARDPTRLITPRLRQALSDFAQMRAPSTAAPPLARPAVTGSTVTAPAAKRSAITTSAITTAAVAAPRSGAAVPPAIDRLHAALRRSPIALHVQRLVPLAKGSQLTRYEVLLRSKSGEASDMAPQAMLKAAVDHGLGSMIDRRVLSELIGWLVRHPEVWRTQAVLFSLNLTATALQDEHFIKFIELCLAKAGLPKAMIGFEIEVPTAVKLTAKVATLANALQALDCPLLLDDFSLRTECFELLRLPGVRYLKLAPAITAAMRTDRLSQASITAVVQMARVLGMHTVAKRMESMAEQEWLTALGVDFVQSRTLSPPAPLDSLARLAR